MIKKRILLIAMAFLCFHAFAQKSGQIELKIIDGEYWWGGLSSIGHQTPYNSTSVATHDLWGDNKGNQAQPLLLSSKGRYVWSEQPIKYVFNTDLKVYFKRTS
ncbi:MAG: hypothetical protein L3J11_09745 [Draconibacterium sp.]|nr:hypothetical protein [Draconibacterium sp.]